MKLVSALCVVVLCALAFTVATADRFNEYKVGTLTAAFNYLFEIFLFSPFFRALFYREGCPSACLRVMGVMDVLHGDVEETRPT